MTDNRSILTNAERFIKSLPYRNSPHKRVYASDNFCKEYDFYQEQKDLERYKSFMNSSAYDDIKEIETEDTEPMKSGGISLAIIRKRGALHDDL